METKICTKCGKELPLDDFHWRDKAKGIKRSECKNCRNALMNAKNAANRKAVQQLKEKQACEKCGEKRWYLLDYHHINPNDKKKVISKLMVYSSQQALQKEIKKCILLCANCHREFHYLEKEKNITIDEYLKDEIKT